MLDEIFGSKGVDSVEEWHDENQAIIDIKLHKKFF